MTPKPTQMDSTQIHRRNNAPILTTVNHQFEDVVKAKQMSTSQPYKWIPVWRTLLVFAYIHAVFPYGVYLFFTRVKWATHIFVWVSIYIGGLGITAGAHRLWAHKSYRARAPLRIILALFNASAFQRSIYDWVRDHRSHHRFTDTDADPYNSQRGFFFSHMGWLLIKKHPDVQEKGNVIDMSDLESDWVVMLQKKYYGIIMPICMAVLPMAIPVYLWGEDPWNAWIVCCVSRWCYMLHSTWVVNSLAHIYGNKPYDKSITPAQNVYVAIIAFGEGWHNYHHAFPWDYKTSEFSSWELNWTSAFIDFFAKIGWAYNLKTANVEMIKKRVLSTGDGSHTLHQHLHIKGNAWGWDDLELTDEDKSMACILFPKTEK
uniref:Acyl-CoA Delta(11) desaturase n=3 Tax=Lygus hesperus TaxID=30085 RepID=A0A0A9WGL8_LYGHE